MANGDITTLPTRIISSNSSEFGRVARRTSLRANDEITRRNALISTNASLMASRWPHLANNPQSLIEMASSVDPITAATQGSILGAQHSISEYADAWAGKPEEEQRSDWSLLTEQQQQALLKAGVEAPS